MRILYEFTSKTCPICQNQKDMVKEFCIKKKIKHKIIDVNKNVKLAQRYNVTSLPTNLLVKQERMLQNVVTPIKSVSGRINEKKLEGMVK